MTASPKPLQIEFVSDVVCPWCVVGLGGLETALGVLAAEGITAEIRFQPFELNPDMAPEGENITEHIGRKYGATPEQSAKNRTMIRDRAAEAWPDDGKGFEMRMGPDSRIWNTFDAHRLLQWAGTIGLAEQRALKEALFRAHFTDTLPLSDAEVLADAAEAAGLDRAEAQAVLADGLYAAEVRDAEALWRARGITGVPAVVVEGKWLISGGQPAAVFEEALRKIAGEGT
ncbi:MULTISPECIES: DsbA family oxidoreductase [unclassified Brevundimonas]|jgi:predicted DsbA family dithiol-disulfide isomerase|uniref:DsbA family oxidoreductase n=1 Tax=unclassified Brevundimonas TaxID=2622653 RepID=UPI000C49A495|nr:MULTISPECIES: DsbA family oxidoreductase [unclassified Brevundimonas]MAL89344.1 disulfide bond formation protein DsbA [Brevundimonas sp.]|tara:strand:- start:80688 stop:81374 length:687 start_codon:yes stop_codon:yes gene_type:complete